jgi:hypothetical protein
MITHKQQQVGTMAQLKHLHKHESRDQSAHKQAAADLSPFAAGRQAGRHIGV